MIPNEVGVRVGLNRRFNARWAVFKYDWFRFKRSFKFRDTKRIFVASNHRLVLGNAVAAQHRELTTLYLQLHTILSWIFMEIKRQPFLVMNLATALNGAVITS